MTTKEVGKSNPANGKLELPKGYRPMSVGQRRLEVPPIDGFHLHWFRGTPGNLARARQAGYTPVTPDEVDLNDFDLAGNGEGNKGTDMGSSQVSVVTGDNADETGQPNRLYLMKCPTELYEYAQGLLNGQVDMTVEALKGGKVGVGQQGETRADSGQRYLKEVKAPILTRKR